MKTSGNGLESTTVHSEPSDWDGKRKTRSDKGSGDPERRKHREKLSTAPFIAWDGEGYSTNTGEHHYMLFGNSVGDSIRGVSLDYRDCFPLLLMPRDGINIIYGGDYDIVMMIHTMPLKVRQRLHSGAPTKFDGYRMVWYRRKMFFLKHLESGRSTVLYDVLSFFQCSFVKACKEYLGEDETLLAIHEMKLKRDSFTLDDEAVDGYWKSELVYLVKLMDELRRLLLEVGIKPKGWYGPGAVASGLMAKHNMRRYVRPIPEAVVDIAERAYFGGRFEMFKVGKMEKVYQYDIRSAYPAAIAHMPDFYSAEWHHFTADEVGQQRMKQDICPYFLYCVSWDIPFRPWTVGPLPWRSAVTGNIYFPFTGHRSWYWGIEIMATLSHFPDSQWSIHECWVSAKLDGRIMPFSWVADMYEARARMKAEGNPAEKALKLGMNSLYGKLAQSKGARYHPEHGWKKPPWHNVLAAGYITAFTRATIYNALRSHQEMLVAIETDAIFTLKPIPKLTLSTELGAWEKSELEQILYVHSGVYYALKDGEWKLKTRGVEADKSRTIEQWLEIFSDLPQGSHIVSTTLRRFGTDVRLPATYARWFEFTAETEMPAKRSKRVHLAAVCPTCVCSDKSYAEWFHYVTPPIGSVLSSDHISSAPYKFPWRNDVHYSWPSFIRSDIVEDTPDLVWSYD